MILRLTLTNCSGATADVEFEVLSHSAAQKWARALSSAQAESSIRERHLVQNFHANDEEKVRELVAQLESVIQKLNSIHPQLITESIDIKDLQKSVNRLHLHFADSHHVASRITEQSDLAWQEFNNILHALEGVQRSSFARKNVGVPCANVLVTWNNNFRTPIGSDDEKHFTIKKDFGTCYVNYCQVGRHFYELFLAQDDFAADDHILPLENISADSYFWFGPTHSEQVVESKWWAIQKWFEKNSEKFSRLGYTWGDSSLRIGWLPVARIVGDYTDDFEKLRLIERLNDFDRVESMSLIKV